MWGKQPKPDFNGRTVLITGGSRGIGRVTAEQFLRAGARVAVCARDAQRLDNAVQELATLGEVTGIAADLGSRAGVQQVAQQTQDRFGAVDVLVNNAGLAQGGPFAEQDPDSIDAILDVNVRGLLQLTRLILPGMLERGSGVIVNVASGAGLSGFAGLVTYCASKFAVVGFSQSLAQEAGDRGVRVHALCPGRVATDMQEQVFGRRQGMDPAKVAAAILQLAGPKPPAAPGDCLTLS